MSSQGKETKLVADTNAVTNTDPNQEMCYQPPSSYQIVGLVTNPETKIKAGAEAKPWCQLPPFSDFTSTLVQSSPESRRCQHQAVSVSPLILEKLVSFRHSLRFRAHDDGPALRRWQQLATLDKNQ